MSSWFQRVVKIGFFLLPNIPFVFLTFFSAAAVGCDTSHTVLGLGCPTTDEEWVLTPIANIGCCPPETSDWSYKGFHVSCCEYFPHKCERSDSVQTSSGSFAAIYVDGGVVILNSRLHRYEPPDPSIERLLLEKFQQNDYP